MPARYGSDLIVDLMKLLGIEAVALNPGSSFRGIHDSLVNYESGTKPNPEMILCCHEEIAVAVAHGYFKATGKIMPAIVHNVVGLQHASMAIYNAWCDRTPVMVMGGTGPMNSSKRRPWIDWIHTAQVQGNLVRDFVKWDDQPFGVEAIPSSMMRGYRIAMSDPHGPVYLCFDVSDQEAPIDKEIPLPDPRRFRPPAPLQAEAEAIKEAARLLASAQNPVIVADYVGRNHDAVLSLVQLADLLSIPVIDLGARLNFPNTHALNLTGKNQDLIANADVIMGLDVTDLYGALVKQDPATHAAVPATKPGCKVIHVTLADLAVRSLTSDFQELAPVDLPIVANTKVFLPALIEELQRQGKFSKSVVEERRKALAAQHDEMHGRWEVFSSGAGMKSRSRRRAWPTKSGKRLKTKTGCWLPERSVVGPAVCGPGINPACSSAATAAAVWDMVRRRPSARRCPIAARARFASIMQRDGEMLYTPSAMWTAANTGVPLLTVMTNNRVYYNDVEHQENVAITRGRPVENKLVGMEMAKPAVDFANLARSFSLHGEGPITEPEQIRPAVERAIKVIKEEKRPALVDVYMQMI